MLDDAVVDEDTIEDRIDCVYEEEDRNLYRALDILVLRAMLDRTYIYFQPHLVPNRFSISKSFHISSLRHTFCMS